MMDNFLIPHNDIFMAVDHLSTVMLNQNPTTVGTIDYNSILSKAFSRALDGGTAGASAAVVQVLSLMWLRTALNYQYRYGNNTIEAIKTLYSQGGIPRLYQGLPFAIIQGPLSRFGDTAANALILSLVTAVDSTGTIPVFVRTGLGSIGAGLWRIILMPIDTAKTSLQVNGPIGWGVLVSRVKTEGISVLYAGSIASSVATFVGHYPWFLTYNYLNDVLPLPSQSIKFMEAFSRGSAQSGFGLESIFYLSAFQFQNVLSTTDPAILDLTRSAFIGLCASSFSDICSNSIRVLKTAKQTSGNETSYVVLAKEIIQEDGIKGLLGRGLQTRLFTNALQGMLFSVLFKYFQSHS
eukprot:gene8881-11978_t